MNLQYIKLLIVATGLSQADLARAAQVSRAAVCKWFQVKGEWVNIETNSLIKLAAALGVSPHELLKESTDLSALAPRFLWDSLYPSMEEFLYAVSRRRLPALARLIQVLGFRDSVKIAGKEIISLFPRYKNLIKPARRKNLEVIWPIYASKS